MAECLPPLGTHPAGEYAEDLSICRTKDGQNAIIFVSSYKPEDDPEYENPENSVFAWQNRDDAIKHLSWIRYIYSVIEANDPRTHSHVQR